MSELHFVFDEYPSPNGPRFIELENSEGHSINYGEWRPRFDGNVSLVIPDYRTLLASALSRLDEIYDPEDEALYRLREEIRRSIL